MENSKMNQQQSLSQLQLQLLQMGFKLNSIQQALKLTKDKEKVIQNLITSQQLEKINNQNASLFDLNSQNAQNKIKDENQQNDGYQSIQQQYKMIFLARMDIKIGLGKMAAQVATSALAAFKQIQTKIDKDQQAQIAYYEWQQSGQKKIVVKVNSDIQLLKLVETLQKQKINVYVNKSKKQDQLQIPEGTITVAAVGPAPQDLLNKLTGHLKLF